MKTPIFMKGVTRSTSDPMHAADVPQGQLRTVSWAAAPPEAAGPLPMQALPVQFGVRPMTEQPSGPPLSPPGAGFEPLSSSNPSPAAPATAMPASTSAARELSPRVEAAIMQLKLTGERLAEQARSDALEVGLLVARRILEREITANLEALFSLIKSAIRRVGESRTTVVRLSPGDFARLKDAADTSLTLGRVDLQADDSLGPGDVMVDSEHSTVDGRLSTRLEELARALDGEGS
jgi:flagellar assembly protein FliH